MYQFALLLFSFSCIIFLVSVNKLDSHNKSHNLDIVLEKLWVAQFGWLRLCTDIAMGMVITNCWKLFRYGVKRDRHDKFISIREFSEWIAVDWFNNTFTTYTGTPEKNITYLGDIYNEDTVFTCWNLNYYSSSPRNSEISTIPDITIATDWTTVIGHTDSKEVELDGGRYNRAARDYWYRRLPNGNICLKRSLWYCHDCLIRFWRRTYYCKQNGRDCFASHHDSLICLPCHVFCLTSP